MKNFSFSIILSTKFLLVLLMLFFAETVSSQTIFWPKVEVAQKGKLFALVKDYNNAVFAIQHNEMVLEDSLTGNPYTLHEMYISKYNSTGRFIWTNLEANRLITGPILNYELVKGIKPKLVARNEQAFVIVGDVYGEGEFTGFNFSQTFFNGAIFGESFKFSSEFSALVGEFDSGSFIDSSKQYYQISWFGRTSGPHNFGSGSELFFGQKLFNIDNVHFYCYGYDPNTEKLIIYNSYYLFEDLYKNFISLDAKVNHHYVDQDTAFLFYPDFVRLENDRWRSAEVTYYDYDDFIGYPKEQIKINDFIRCSDLSFVVVGDILDTDEGDQIFFMKLSPDGEPISIQFYESDYFPFESIVNIVEIPAGLVVAGHQKDDHDQYRVTILLLDREGRITTSTKDLPFEEDFYTVFPNPVDQFLHIQLNNDSVKGNVEIVNLDGRTVYKGLIEDNLTVDVEHLIPGIYLLKMTTGGMSSVKKVIVKR